MKNLILILTVAVLVGCATPETSALSADDFKSEFFEDCKQITEIAAFHHWTSYEINHTSEGNFTRAYFSLKEMSEWLRQCGRNPSEVAQLME